MEQRLKDMLEKIKKAGDTKVSTSVVPWTSASSIKPTSDTRRNNKPLMEKRRRARINQSVALLKNILLDSRQDIIADKPQKQAKLEKADILEMTVRHFQMTRAFDKNNVDKYRSGFSDCVREVERFFNMPEIHTRILPELADLDIKVKLLRHLESCTSEIESKKTTSDEVIHTQSIDNSERNMHGLKPSDINNLNAFQEQMTKELIRNIGIQKQSEKENLFLRSDQNDFDYNMRIDKDIVKQETFETMLSQEGSSHDANFSETSQKTSESTFKDNSMVSVIPSTQPPGQAAYLANVFGVNNVNTSHYFAPYLSKIPEQTTTGSNKKKTKYTEENIASENVTRKRKFLAFTLSKSPNYIGVYDINESGIEESNTSEQDIEEPLDFSMHSNAVQNDPMWRPW